MANVVEFLRSFRRGRQQQRSDRPTDSQVESILSMTIDEFRRQDLAVLVRSYLLGEDFYLVSNRHCLPRLDGRLVTYLPEELEAIYQLSPDFIKRIHKIKKCFGGEILTEGID